MFSIALILGLLASCRRPDLNVPPLPDQQPDTIPVPPLPDTLPTPPPIAEPTEQAKIILITNAERAKKGLSPVRANPQLMEAAQKYAELMASKNKLSHTIDGDVGGRVNATGYRWRACGENIAWNYRDAATVMDGWMNSSGHRRNILTPVFAEIGVGIARNSRGEIYHCQVFATPAVPRLLPLLPGGLRPGPHPPPGRCGWAGGRVFRTPEERTEVGGTAASSVAILPE